MDDDIRMIRRRTGVEKGSVTVLQVQANMTPPTHSQLTVNTTDYRMKILEVIRARFPKGSEPHEIDSGGERRVFGSAQTDWVLKAPIDWHTCDHASSPEMVEKHIYDALLHRHMKSEWIVPEQHEVLPVHGIAEKTLYLPVDIQKRLPAEYFKDDHILMWCYGRAEFPDHLRSSRHLKKPVLLTPDPAVRAAYIMINEQIIMGRQNENFDSEKFLRVQSNAHFRQLFERITQNARRRDEFADFANAGGDMAKDGEIVEGIGHHNVMRPEDRTSLLIVDAQLSLHRVLKGAAKTLHECNDFRELRDQHEKLEEMLHAENYWRALGGMRQHIGMKARDAAHMDTSRNVDWGQLYDVHFESLAEKYYVACKLEAQKNTVENVAYTV